MRGKDHPVPNAKYTHRITPAYAGKSIHATLDAPPEQDHPRLCGEKVLFHIVRIKRKGSPPPMRGKVKEPLSEYELMTDHPRLCGEKAAFRFSVEICLGSPPPMRGKGCRSYCIPCTYRDHPRLCGEKRSTIIRNTIPKGSPPPMRGKVSTQHKE